jgi:putative transposase
MLPQAAGELHRDWVMPRAARLELPGIPMHVVQRGVNRCAIFLDDDDRRHYRRLLYLACRKAEVALHAYVFMDNHVHLLLSAARAGAVSKAMRLSGHAYVQAFNDRHGRTGTLFQGRFKSSLVDTDGYVLAALRYIDLNPVRAALVARAEDFAWSSARVHLGLDCDPCLVAIDGYVGLGATPEARANAYRACLAESISVEDLAAIRNHVAKERALGSDRFQAMVQATLGRPASIRPRGRPTRRSRAGTA